MVNLQRVASNSVYFLFFLPYLGSAMPAYLWALLFICIFIRTRLSPVDLALAGVAILLFGAKILQVGLPISELLFRYYFGFIIFYYFFKMTGATFRVEKLLKVYCIVVLIEAFLINTVVPVSLMRNYPDMETATSHATKFFGFYQRPYSVGTNATISSMIIVFMLFYLEIYRKRGVKLMTRGLEILAAITVLAFVSGGGMMFYAVYWGYKLNLFSRARNLVGLGVFTALFIWVAIYVSTLESDNALSKISITYFEFLIGFKTNQINETAYALDQSSWIIGADFSDKSELLIWNDFSIRDLVHCLGLGGVSMLLLFCLSKINRSNKAVVVICLLSLFHYGSTFAMPGAMMLGYVLNLNRARIDTQS